MTKTILQMLLLGLPTNFLVLFAGTAIQGKRIPLAKLFGFSLIVAIGLYLFRSIPGPFGVHVILHAMMVFGIIRYLTGARWSMVLLGTLIPQLLSAIGEGLISVPVIVGVMRVPLAEALSDLKMSLLGGWLSNTLLIILSLVLYLRGRSGTGTARHGQA